ncbi:MAG: response regulator transcription factor [Deltaproteobacteria bacterium]|nr:response regulator transcription factor [Deltaproteobacteria bacterium]
MRICIVEDDRLLLESLCQLLGGERGVEVVGAYTSAEEAQREAPWAAVDVLLADINLPGASGVELIRARKLADPGLNCMAYTIFEDRSTVFAAIKAGACGYLLKGASPRELIESLRELHEGGAPMSPKIARKVILEIQQGDRTEEAAGADVLSRREVEILKLIEAGRSYKEIAAALGISAHTVHSHIKHIYEKVHAHGRNEALRRARNLGAL